MPLFSLKCTACSSEHRKLMSKKENLPCECGGTLEVQLPKELNTQTMEMRDPRRGKQLPKGHDGNMKRRMRKHHDQYEVQEKIDKYGMDDALRYGWVKQKK